MNAHYRHDIVARVGPVSVPGTYLEFADAGALKLSSPRKRGPSDFKLFRSKALGSRFRGNDEQKHIAVDFETGSSTTGFSPATRHSCAAFSRPGGSAAKAAGFTLVELMVVLVIVGLMGVAVVLTAPDDSRTLMREADTLAARLVHANEEAILTARGVQVTVDSQGYAFARQNFGQWQPLDEAPFEPVAWIEGTTAVLDERRAQVSFRFDPTGGGTAQRVLLTRNGERVEVAMDAAGKVQVRASY